jgi:hypothetical protein
MHAEAATLPAAWQGRVRAHVFYHGPLGHNTACVLVQWELMAALTLMAIWAQHSVCVGAVGAYGSSHSYGSHLV